jgi:hypothetical protein
VVAELKRSSAEGENKSSVLRYVGAFLPGALYSQTSADARPAIAQAGRPSLFSQRLYIEAEALNEADSQFLQAADKGVGLRSCLEDLNQSFWFEMTGAAIQRLD